MDEDQKVYYPEVLAENPFPTEEEAVSVSISDTSEGDTHKPTATKAQDLPTRRVAYELMATALNTRSKKILAEFDFGKSGALQIGEYDNGISGDIRISPNGIVARDSAGVTTFALDGTTGDAVFKGTIQANTVVSGLVVVGNNQVIIDGESSRIVINDGQFDRVLIGFQRDGF